MQVIIAPLPTRCCWCSTYCESQPAGQRRCWTRLLKSSKGLNAAETLGAIMRRLPEGPAHAFRCVDALDRYWVGGLFYYS